MTKRNSTASTPAVYTGAPKPAKRARSFLDPTQPYPLTVHPAGYFSKKVRGKVRYLARWDEGAEVAEQRWAAKKDAWLSGREPSTDPDQEAASLTVRKLVNDYLNEKRRAVELGRITSCAAGKAAR